jgi:large subunit ribosomal protein L7/L12
MSLSCRYAAQCCARQLRAAPIRASSSLLQHQRMTRRYNSTDAAASPKISAIVDQISQLTLLETADLVASLKVRTLPTPAQPRNDGHH